MDLDRELDMDMQDEEFSLEPDFLNTGGPGDFNYMDDGSAALLFNLSGGEFGMGGSFADGQGAVMDGAFGLDAHGMDCGVGLLAFAQFQGDAAAAAAAEPPQLYPVQPAQPLENVPPQVPPPPLGYVPQQALPPPPVPPAQPDANQQQQQQEEEGQQVPIVPNQANVPPVIRLSWEQMAPDALSLQLIGGEEVQFGEVVKNKVYTVLLEVPVMISEVSYRQWNANAVMALASAPSARQPFGTVRLRYPVQRWELKHQFSGRTSEQTGGGLVWLECLCEVGDSTSSVLRARSNEFRLVSKLRKRAMTMEDDVLLLRGVSETSKKILAKHGVHNVGQLLAHDDEWIQRLCVSGKPRLDDMRRAYAEAKRLC